ncbi:unnamed protein product [Withania somnifera]
MSSEGVLRNLRSISEPTEALALFKSVAEMPKVVHTTETCNYMLEYLRVLERMDDMVVVFDLMQKQIIYRNLVTYLIIFKGLHIRGGIREAPFALERMKKAGFVLNAYSYNGLIHLIRQAGFWQEGLKVRRMISEKLKPSLKTYSELMVACGKRRNIETVMRLLREMDGLGVRPNIYTYTICIRVLGRAGKIDDACAILKRMDDEGCAPDVVTYTLDIAKEIFFKMKAGSRKPDRVTYITLLDRDFLNRMEADGYKPNVVSFTILVDALCKVGKVSEAFSTLDVMKEKGILPNLHTYNSLIRGLLRKKIHGISWIEVTAYTYILIIDYYGKSGEPDKALETFEMMKAHGIVPNIVACNASLYSVEEMVRLGEAKRIVDGIRESGYIPNSITYNTMMNCYSNAGKIDEAIKLLSEMLERGCDPDVIVVNSLIDILYKDGRASEAWALFYRLKDMMPTPTVVNYNTLLAGLGKEGKIREAYELLDSMGLQRCAPYTITYNTLLDSLCKNGEVDTALDQIAFQMLTEAFLLFHQMKKKMYLDSVTMYAVLPIPVKDGLIEDAFKIVEGFVNQALNRSERSFWSFHFFCRKTGMCRICRNDIIIVSVIRVLCKQKKALDGHDLFVKFKNTFRIRLLNVHRKELAWHLFKEMKIVSCVPDVYTYNLFPDELGKSGKVDELFELYEEMLYKGCNPIVITYNILISGSVKSNEVERAIDFYYDLVSLGFTPTPCTYGPLINGLLKVQNFDKAKDFFEEMVESRMNKEGVRPDIKTYTILVDCLCTAGKVDDALHYFEELKSAGLDPDFLQPYDQRSWKVRENEGITNFSNSDLEPDVFTYNALIRGYSKSGDPDGAYAIYEKMMVGGCSPNSGTFTQLPN